MTPNQLLNNPSQLLETLKQQQQQQQQLPPSSNHQFDSNQAAMAMANFFSRPLESLCAAAALAAATTGTNQPQLNSLLNPATIGIDSPPTIASNLNSLQLGNDLKQRFAGVDLASLISAAQQQQHQQFQQYPINFQLQQKQAK